MGIFERYLSVWVGLAILAGVLLGSLFPAFFSVLAALEFAHVNILIAVLIWLIGSKQTPSQYKGQRLVISCLQCIHWPIGRPP